MRVLCLAVALAALAACQEAAPPTAEAQPAPAAAAAPVSPTAEADDFWVGRWTGVEGNYLDIVARGNGAYTLTIQELDGVGTYEGVAADRFIVFERRGESLRLTPGDGEATGLKWLADKEDCIVVAPGEGYCR